MTDVVLSFGADLSQLNAAFNQAQREVANEIRKLQRRLTTELKKVERAYANVAAPAEASAKAQLSAADAGNKAAQEIDSVAIQQASSKWTTLASAVSAAAGAYLGARSSAAAVEREQRSQISNLVRLAAGYVSVREAVSGFNSIVDVGAAFQAQRAQLRGLFQSAAQGDAAFQWLQTQRVQAEGFQQALVTLRGFGVQPLFETLQALNAAALTLGDGNDRLGRLALAIGQGFGQGALRAEELNQLIDSGIPVISIFSDILGVTGLQVRELASAGKLGAREIQLLVDRIGELGQGGEQRQLSILNGQLRQLSREASLFGGTIADSGLLASVQAQVAGLLAEIERLRATGELQSIAENISIALSSIAEGVAALVNRALLALRRLSADGSLATFGANVGAILEQLAAGIGPLLDNLDSAAAAAIAFFGAIEAAKLTIFVASLGGLGFALFRHRRLVLAALIATRGFIAAMLAGAIGAGKFAAGLAFLRSALLANLALLGIVGAGVATLTIAGILFFRRQAEEIEAQQRALARLRQESTVLKQFFDLQSEAVQRGLTGIAETISRLRQARNLERIGTQDAIDLARQRFTEAVELQDQLEQKIKERAAIEQQLARAVADAERAAQQKILQGAISSNSAEIQDARRKLRELEAAEQRSADRIKAIRDQLAQIPRSLEVEILDIRRQGQSDSSREFDVRLEGLRRERELQQVLQQINNAKSEAEAKAALDAGRFIQQRLRQLSQQVAGESDRIALLEKAAAAEQRIGRTEIALLRRSADANRQQQQAVKDRLSALTSQAATLKQQLEALNAIDVTIDIKNNLAQLNLEVERLQRNLTLLNNGKLPENVSSAAPEVDLNTTIKATAELDTAPVEKAAKELQAELQQLDFGIELPTFDAVEDLKKLQVEAEAVDQQRVELEMQSNVPDRAEEIGDFLRAVQRIDREIQFQVNSNSEQVRQEAERLAKLLDALKQRITPVRLTAADNELQRRFDLIERQLAELAKGVTIPIRTSGGLPSGVARNTGGYIPGGGPDRDSVLAALTPGEFVIRRAASRVAGGALLAGLNAARNERQVVAVLAGHLQRVAPAIVNVNAVASLPRIPNVKPLLRMTANLPPAASPQPLNTGGPVLAGAGGAPVLGEYNINFNDNGTPRRLRTDSQEDAERFVELFNRLDRLQG